MSSFVQRRSVMRVLQRMPIVPPHPCTSAPASASCRHRGKSIAMATADISLTDSTARFSGPWTAQTLDGIEQRIAKLDWPTGPIRFELSAVEALDTVGAWLVFRTARDLRGASRDVSFDGIDP